MSIQTRTKKKDDELLMWTIVGAIFTVMLLFVDFAYSSVNEMGKIARIAIWIGHALLSLLWIITIAKWKDPNYDKTREYTVYLCVVLGLIIGIHHSTVVEDDQVIIDSHENAVKDTLR